MRKKGMSHTFLNRLFEYSAEPRGIEPRSPDFQSGAYTTSAKVPYAEGVGFEPTDRSRDQRFSVPHLLLHKPT